LLFWCLSALGQVWGLTPAIVDHAGASTQGNGCLGPAFHGCPIGCFRNLEILDAGKVLDDVVVPRRPCPSSRSLCGIRWEAHEGWPAHTSIQNDSGCLKDLLARALRSGFALKSLMRGM
jgi:hypothetical protein